MKDIAAVMIAALLIISPGCSGREEKADERARPEVSETATLAPDIDLHTAVAQGNLEAIRQHIEAGSDLNVRASDSGACPLATAATFDQTEAAMALIKAGADLNFRANDGATPLHVAAFFCRREIVKALLEAGADRGIRNKYGSTPLEVVTVPFESVKGFYDSIGESLELMGVKLDYEYIKATRPVIAEMLK